jgi:fatty acid desaturase
MAMPKSASLGDASLGDDCLLETPRLLTKTEIQEFSRIDSWKFTCAVLIEALTICLAIAVCQTWWNPLTYAAAVVVIGSRINGLACLMHDAAHHRAYRNRALNDLIGELLALPTSASMAGYRNSHFAHHRELNSENDPDWARNLGLEEFVFPASPPSVALRILCYLAGLRTFAAVTGFHKNKQTRQIPRSVARGRLVFFLTLVGASIVFGFWKGLLLYWVAPLLTVFLAIRYVRNIAEHYAVEHESVLNESRTVIAPAWELWLIAPWGLNYHLEHHLYPGIPCFRLADVHRRLMRREPFARQAHVTEGYFRGLLSDCSQAADPSPARAISAAE